MLYLNVCLVHAHATQRAIVLHDLVQERVDETYKDSAKWTRMSIMSTAGSGFFSSDRTIDEYARDIWRTEPCHVPAPQD